MDGLRLGGVLLILVLTSACDSGEKSSKVFPEDTEDCREQQVSNEFLVQWADGRITKESGENREQFFEDFIEPHMDQIIHVEHDHQVRLPQAELGIQSDEDDEDKSYIDNWGITATHAAPAWDQGVRGQKVVVAVIDSGVDREHLALRERIFVNSGEEGFDEFGKDKRFNLVDDDGNGYVDDYQGYDFVSRSGDVIDDNGHGTHVAGIIAASHEANQPERGYVQGVAPGAEIMPLYFISRNSGRISHAIEAIQYARDNGAQIINASWGGRHCSQLLADSIASLGREGVLFVTASGNEHLNIDIYHQFPASYSFAHLLTVGSLHTSLFMAQHSNYGENQVDLFAPGFEIYSTVPGDRVKAMSGTSMAAPFVSGAAALLWSQYPEASPRQIRQALMNSVDRSPFYRNASEGRLNINMALSYLASIF